MRKNKKFDMVIYVKRKQNGRIVGYYVETLIGIDKETPDKIIKRNFKKRKDALSYLRSQKEKFPDADFVAGTDDLFDDEEITVG